MSFFSLKEQNNIQKYLGKYGPEHRNHEGIYRHTALGEGYRVVHRKYNSGNFHQCSLNMKCDILKEEKREKVIVLGGILLLKIYEHTETMDQKPQRLASLGVFLNQGSMYP